VGGNVRIRPCQVAHGSLTITIAQTPLVSQPAPFSQGETVVAEATDIGAEEAAARLMPLEGTSAAQVAEGLNRLMVSPRDIISIFQALREAGVMDADLEIM
ncbi:MAG: flagellar basal body P-ring protein FlgI, partial [Candidatus Hydrogenedentota bacterium]